MKNNPEEIPSSIFDWIEKKSFNSLSLLEQDEVIKYLTQEEYEIMHLDLVRIKSVAQPRTHSSEIKYRMLHKFDTKYPQAKLVLAGMQVPPNMGVQYSNEFKSMFVDLAKQNSMTLIPFLLEGVGGVKALNQQDAIHPNVEGAKIVAENVWKVLEGVM